ncbi:MAG: hypothetical protein Q7S66_02425 [bacterium]|nr:hypothetical protein [bacterium]
MELISEIIGQIISSIIVIPLAWILATPFILVMSFFGTEAYFINLKKYYKKIKDYIVRSKII